MKNIKEYKNIEFEKPEIIKNVQEELLREHLRYCASKSPYYKGILKNINLKKITLDNISELPFTEKSDLERRNDEFCAVSCEKIVDIVLSSGTTGIPTKIVYTEKDLQRLAYNEEKSFAGCGITAGDMALLTCTIDRCFVAGLAYFLGMRAVGAAAIRNGNNSIESHGEIIRRMKPTVIVGVPTFLRKLGLYLRESGMDPEKEPVSKLVCIGEPLRDGSMKTLKVCDDIEKIWQAKAYSTYATTEIVTTFCECETQQGGHLHPDLGIVEIVGENGKQLPCGEPGEVVVTPLGVEGMPLIRFKTGDISFIIDEKCRCGKSSVRLGPILGRKKQMMKVFGTTIYPQAVYSVLEEIDALKEYCIEMTKESDLSERMTISVAVADGSCTASGIREKLQARLRMRPEVIIVDEETVRKKVYSQKSRKPVRFFDRRSD